MAGEGAPGAVRPSAPGGALDGRAFRVDGRLLRPRPRGVRVDGRGGAVDGALCREDGCPASTRFEGRRQLELRDSSSS